MTKDVPDGVIVGGNPAHIIGKTADLMKKRRGESDSTPQWNIASRKEMEEFYFDRETLRENGTD